MTHALAPFSVGGFLGVMAQLLGVNGLPVLALVIIGGSGAVLAHWRWKRSRWQAFTGAGIVAASAVSILVLSVAQPPQRVPSVQGGRQGGRPAQAAGPPDPNFYLTYDGQFISRKQECYGLLGLCFGQPIAFAIEAFGSQEADGYPVAAGGRSEFSDATMCHAWELPKIDRIDVCELNGAIYSINIFTMAETTLAVATPHDLRVDFSQPVAQQAEAITEKLRTTPFSAQYLQDEGASVFTYAWFFPTEHEGGPDVKIELLARVPGFPDPAPESCSEQPLRYQYADIIAISRKAPTIGVEVSPVMPADLDESTAC